MRLYSKTTRFLRTAMTCALMAIGIESTCGQNTAADSTAYSTPKDSVVVELMVREPGMPFDSKDLKEETVEVVKQVQNMERDWNLWAPNPQRALWMALVIPGAGQMYNRKYWKLPLVYGGFMGCIYAMSWNNMMYKDYSQAYLDIMDDDPGTESYNKFLHLGKRIDDTNIEQYKTIFKKRKDKYRRWRDLSFFCMVGVYALSVIDAYVDAELSVFDISRDLSMKVRPTVIGSNASKNPLYASSLGVNCSINF